jgi:hypothetical protein
MKNKTKKPVEPLYPCPRCGRGNFTKQGLAAHVCKPSEKTPAETNPSLFQGKPGRAWLDALAPAAQPAPPAPAPAQPPAPAPAETELLRPGELSTAAGQALAKAGVRVTAKQVLAAHASAEQGRVAFQVSALHLGLLLLAKKEALPHGGFQKFCSEVVALKNGSNGKRASHLAADEKHNFTRQARTYAHLARHFISDL